uniref:Uncharacterized protein n=1 Tax=Ixodes ricinus TaxID=34613 RepID=A0A6B0U566_IXORI
MGWAICQAVSFFFCLTGQQPVQIIPNHVESQHHPTIFRKISRCMIGAGLIYFLFLFVCYVILVPLCDKICTVVLKTYV